MCEPQENVKQLLMFLIYSPYYMYYSWLLKTLHKQSTQCSISIQLQLCQYIKTL